jgi:hypothetical protein
LKPLAKFFFAAVLGLARLEEGFVLLPLPPALAFAELVEGRGDAARLVEAFLDVLGRLRGGDVLRDALAESVARIRCW